MAKQNNYNCILYEVGDKVIRKYGNTEILEIEETRLAIIGQFTCQFLKFKDKNEDIGAFSNLYLPADDKYKDGLKYLDEVKVTKLQNRSVNAGIKIHERLAKKLLKSNVLTEEDLKPVVVPRGMFNTKPPIKENV